MILSKYNSYIKFTDKLFLITNQLSGNIDVINDSMYGLIQAEIFEEESAKLKETKKYLFARGYLVSNKIDQDSYYAEQKAKILAITKNYTRIHTIIVTYQCNFYCNYCFEKFNHSNMVMDREMVDRVFEHIREFDKGKQYKNPIGLFGGEPLMVENRELVEYILDQGASFGYQFFIPTNGYSLGEYSNLLHNYQFKTIQVTLDGPDFIHDQRRVLKGFAEGTYQKIVQGINKALDTDLPISIRINIDETNVQYLNQLITNFQRYRWFEYSNFRAYLTPCRSDPGRCFRDFKPEMLDQIKQNLGPELRKIVDLTKEPARRLIPSIYNCDACFRQLFYDPSGVLYPCAEAIGHSEMIIGNYLPKIEFNDTYQQLLNRHIFNQESNCVYCNNFQICASGCPYRALLDSGTVSSQDCGAFEEFKYYLRNLIETR